MQTKAVKTHNTQPVASMNQSSRQPCIKGRLKMFKDYRSGDKLAPPELVGELGLY